jgi:hypothetical protein
VTIPSTKSIKLVALAITVGSALAFSLVSPELPASAKVDDALELIAAYRTWTKITKEPIRGASLTTLLNLTVNGPSDGPVAPVVLPDGGG